MKFGGKLLRQSVWPRGVAGLGAAGALLLVLALAAEIALVLPVRAQRDALQAVAPPGPRAATQAALPTAPAVQLQQFYAVFPRLDALSAALGSIDHIALQTGVPLRSAEYRMEQRPGAEAEKLARYRITLRTSGDYAQIRAFLGGTLEQLPYVALDDVQFRRSGEADGALDADVRLSVFLRRE
jgi:hypothetical protein